jgi:hypothetical protein
LISFQERFAIIIVNFGHIFPSTFFSVDPIITSVVILF